MRLKIIISISIFFLLGEACGQIPNGPGGIGSTNGATSLLLWLDATKETGPLGTTFSWSDLSGYNHHFTSGNGARLATDASVPGRRFFQFDHMSSHYFERAYTAALNPANNFTVFVAGQMNTSTTRKTLISSYHNNGIGNEAGYEIYFLPAAGGNECQFYTGRGVGPGSNLDTNSGPSGVWTVTVARQGAPPGSNKRIWTHNALLASSPVAFAANTVRPFRIGAQSNPNTPIDFYEGWIGEIILVSTINSLQLNIIAEYLDAKYNSVFNPSPSATGGLRAQLYAMDNAANGDYDFDVAGIGYNMISSHTDSQGSSFFRIKLTNPATISDQGVHEYFFWGKDNGSLDPVSTDMPVGVQTRMQAVWRAQEQGRDNATDATVAVEVGNLDISFDMTGHGHASVTVSDLVLLIDRNGNGVFADETIGGGGVVTGAVSLGGNMYGFNGVNINNGERFTLGSLNALQTPLPIILGDFRVSREKNSVRIEWETLTEINTDYFTLERSSNGVQWNSIAKITASGNSHALLKYQIADEAPLNGSNYYRLVQTDLDGSFTYSKIREIFFERDEPGSTIFPNPFSSHIEIQLDDPDEYGPVTIKILNLTGNEVLEYHDTAEDGTLMINSEKLETLPSGGYLLQVICSKSVLYRRIMKR